MSFLGAVPSAPGREGLTAMGQFMSELVLSPLGDGRNWRLARPLRYVTSFGRKIRVPAGYVTDLASVPQVFWNILPPFGCYECAAVVHDWLYTDQPYPRRYCDWVLLDAMAELGTPLWKRWTIYLAARAFGASHWQDATQQHSRKRKAAV